ncbi:MAG: hypothetical protein GY861_20735 [bacterium]|nr:hypothetical protein [bacterium]
MKTTNNVFIHTHKPIKHMWGIAYRVRAVHKFRRPSTPGMERSRRRREASVELEYAVGDRRSGTQPKLRRDRRRGSSSKKRVLLGSWYVEKLLLERDMLETGMTLMDLAEYLSGEELWEIYSM